MRHNTPGGRLLAGTACGSDDPTLKRTKATKLRRENIPRNCVNPKDNSGLDSEMERGKKENKKPKRHVGRRSGDAENMASLQKADECSLCSYTNLRLLYWPRINHRGQCGCASRTLAQKNDTKKTQNELCTPPSFHGGFGVKAKKRYVYML